MKATFKQGLKVVMVEFIKLTDSTIEIEHIGVADPKTLIEEKSTPQIKLITDKKQVVKKVLLREKYIPFRSLSISDSIEFGVRNPRNIYNYQKE